MEFTPQEVSTIEKQLGYIVFDWAKHLVQHILSNAKSQGVSKVYMNTMDTLDSGSTQSDKVSYFYEKLPPTLGFTQTQADLRGRGNENLWVFDLNPKMASDLLQMLRMAQTAAGDAPKAQKQFKLENLPRKYQGAFISMRGRKPFYNEDDIRFVLDKLDKGAKKPKQQPKSKAKEIRQKFYYDWAREWSGPQRFHSSVNEKVVLQKIPSATQDIILQDETLTKFWSFLLSQPSHHFDPDSIGFALVSQISNDVWVINEIQTDVLNSYLKIRNDLYKKKEAVDTSLTWETLVDLLTAQNKSNWIPKLESNEALKAQILANPATVQQLPDNTVNIDEWIAEQTAGGQAGQAGLGIVPLAKKDHILRHSLKLKRVGSKSILEMDLENWEKIGRHFGWL